MVLRGQGKPTRATLDRLFGTTYQLEVEHREQVARMQVILVAVRDRCQQMGIQQFAKQAGIDAGNLVKVLVSRRKASQAILAKLEDGLTH